jgi:hypothetical protein
VVISSVFETVVDPPAFLIGKTQTKNTGAGLSALRTARLFRMVRMMRCAATALETAL